MSSELSPQEELVKEQEVIQKGKFQGRVLRELNHYLFSGQNLEKGYTSEVEEFVNEYLGQETDTVVKLLEGLVKKNNAPIHWVEMGGGYGLPMRQVAILPDLKDQVHMTNVDLFDRDIQNLSPEELGGLEKEFPGVTNPQNKPQTITADSTSVVLDRPADLITSLESIQYLKNPLAALCNWYNQLTDNGLLFISTEHWWSDGIRYEGSVTTDDPQPLIDIYQTFQRHQINFAHTKESYRQKRGAPQEVNIPTRTLVVQKKGGTRLQLDTHKSRDLKDFRDFQVNFYEPGKEPISIHENEPGQAVYNSRSRENTSGVL